MRVRYISTLIVISLVLLGFYLLYEYQYEYNKKNFLHKYETEGAIAIGKDAEYLNNFKPFHSNNVGILKEKVVDTMSILESLPKMERYDGITWDAVDNYKFLCSCENNIEEWSNVRRTATQIKLYAMEKLKKDVATRADLNDRERKYAEEYIKENKNIDLDTSFSHLLKLLIQSKPKDLMNLKYANGININTLESVKDMQFCINVSEKVINNLYYYWKDYYYLYHNESKSTLLQSLANKLEIGRDLDFTLIKIIAREAELLKSIGKDYKRYTPSPCNAFDKTKNLKAVKLVKRILKLYKITNHELGKINSDNAGFKTEAFQFRNYLKWHWERELYILLNAKPQKCEEKCKCKCKCKCS